MSSKKESKTSGKSKKSIPDWPTHHKGMKAEDIRKDFINNLIYNIAKDKYTLTAYDKFLGLSYTVRERLIERWIATQQLYHTRDVKRVYYLSLEFLMGRLLGNNIFNLGLQKNCRETMQELGFSVEEIEEQEFDAGLGNGGLGRLAACFLDSMATLELPAIGYGIRYEFGIFNQKIIDGCQHELPEQWLQLGNPWEIERPEYQFKVKFNGKTMYYRDKSGRLVVSWVDTEDVIAIPYDTPIPGFQNGTVNTLRLWSSRSPNEIDLQHFHTGDYIGACQDKLVSENISKVLYPNDSNHSGKQLRLKQQHFFTSASLQDIIRRFLHHGHDFADFPKYNAIQLNDTHPAIAIAELMRLLLDEHFLDWDQAWDICVDTFAYTNHTLMPEALEKWAVSLLEQMLPRHMEIIYEINSRFLRKVSLKYPGDTEKLRRMSLIEEEGEKQVRMAFLAIVGSHSINGVAELHTKLLTDGLVRDFYHMFPERFNNKTNGITQRRWLYKANENLATLITETIGEKWVKNLDELKRLVPFAEDSEFCRKWRLVKKSNKERLADQLRKHEGFHLNVDAIFDVQVKRIHEYKRQLLNALHCIHLYRKIKNGQTKDFLPRTVMIGGKAAPGYYMAKLLIKFINNIADVINSDPQTKGLLQLFFTPNYRVTLAEQIIPATDLSQHISTAGTEASGTSNMKFSLNGGLIIGTMDGANIEIAKEIGEHNMFIFGMDAEQVEQLRAQGYDPRIHYEKNRDLKEILDLIGKGFFSPEDPDLFRPIYDGLLYHDPYMIMADFDSYVACQQSVEQAYKDIDAWTRMSIYNTAYIGKFTSDRTIRQYAEQIWGIQSVPVDFKR
ncbi:MAG: glycogen/starch/alpha-glucan phosphorylase [Chitinispirillaceae bacterium]